MTNTVKVGDAIILVKDIYDHGEVVSDTTTGGLSFMFVRSSIGRAAVSKTEDGGSIPHGQATYEKL